MNNEAIKKIADTYGYDAQSRQLIEEMAELTQAINKLWRHEQSVKSKDDYEMEEMLIITDKNIECLQNIHSELADVEIMITQLKYLMNCEKEVEQIIEQKLNWKLERIEKNE